MVRVHDTMTLDVLTVSPEATLREAAGLLSDEHVSGAPVVAGSKVVGVVSTSDIIEFVADEPGVPTDRPRMVEPSEWPGADVEARIEATEGPEWNFLEEHTVSEVMTQMS